MEPSTGRLKNSNTTCLNDQPILQDLERLTGSQILMANDANCFALAEALIGAAAGAGVVFGVILGTGVGGGVVVNGRILPAYTESAASGGTIRFVENPTPATVDAPAALKAL
jgi:predicted NBD/HSP70 family sugar kinase